MKSIPACAPTLKNTNYFLWLRNPTAVYLAAQRKPSLVWKGLIILRIRLGWLRLCACHRRRIWRSPVSFVLFGIIRKLEEIALSLFACNIPRWVTLKIAFYFAHIWDGRSENCSTVLHWNQSINQVMDPTWVVEAANSRDCWIIEPCLHPYNTHENHFHYFIGSPPGRALVSVSHSKLEVWACGESSIKNSSNLLTLLTLLLSNHTWVIGL